MSYEELEDQYNRFMAAEDEKTNKLNSSVKHDLDTKEDQKVREFKKNKLRAHGYDVDHMTDKQLDIYWNAGFKHIENPYVTKVIGKSKPNFNYDYSAFEEEREKEKQMEEERERAKENKFSFSKLFSIFKKKKRNQPEDLIKSDKIIESDPMQDENIISEEPKNDPLNTGMIVHRPKKNKKKKKK